MLRAFRCVHKFMTSRRTKSAFYQLVASLAAPYLFLEDRRAAARAYQGIQGWHTAPMLGIRRNTSASWLHDLRALPLTFSFFFKKLSNKCSIPSFSGKKRESNVFLSDNLYLLYCFACDEWRRSNRRSVGKCNSRGAARGAARGANRRVLALIASLWRGAVRGVKQRLIALTANS